jgi:hypothetical protein
MTYRAARRTVITPEDKWPNETPTLILVELKETPR